MVHRHYHLQYHLYVVALHRYLRWRLPGYDYERHFGGVYYLFLRGMIGPSTPQTAGVSHGVFYDRPPVALVEALDRLLAAPPSASGESG
jgi:exodeoxyribonuclease V beta subunit